MRTQERDREIDTETANESGSGNERKWEEKKLLCHRQRARVGNQEKEREM